MARILFVDDEPKVLEGLRRMLHSMRKDWEMSFANSGAEALATLEQAPFDVVVTDMRMPGMDGAELLGEVRKRHPQIVRIILSGHAGDESTLRSVETAHQCMSKPCDAEMLRDRIGRAFTLRKLLVDPRLGQLISRMTSLPSMPAIYLELLEALRSPDVSVQQIGEIMEKDMAMTAKVLQLVNSAFFGLRRKVGNVREAVVYLGLETISALVFSVKVFSQFQTPGLAHFSIEALWKHSLATAKLARRIARLEGAPERVCDDALMAGLLHDLGKLVLVVNLPQEYDEALGLAQAEDLTESEAEQQVLGATHAAVGTYLLWLWGLPDAITEATAFHHNPRESPGRDFGPLTAVYVANALLNATELDMEYLGSLSDRLPKWRTILQEAL